MFKNALVYRIDHWDTPTPAEIESRLAQARFVACGATQPESHGFVEPRGAEHGPLLESVAGQWILSLRSETKGVPGSVVKAELETKLAQIEKDTGRRPRGKVVRQLKEEIVHTLLPRAFPKHGSTLIWLDNEARTLLIAVGSAKKADGVITRLVELLGGGLRISPLQTQLSPATAMAAWLTEQEAPSGFAIDRDCELKQPDSEKAAVRYARHPLEIEEIAEHIKQGKLPTQLALTWASRVSFTLTENLALKKIKLLDVVLEGAAQKTDGGEDHFDADVALATGELRKLLPALVDALGGPLQEAAAATAQPVPEPA